MSSETYFVEVTNCRMCGCSEVEQFISLGNQYVVDFVKEPANSLFRAPLALMRCCHCNLVQLRHSVNRDRLYKKFWYKSSTQEVMRDALRAIVQRACEVTYVAEGDTVLDIGCNDGQLLGWYGGGIRTVGIDPCPELIDEGLKRERLDVGIKDFFSFKAAEPYGPYKVITAVAMFYDLEDPVQFLKDCGQLLKKDGVLIVQMNYLATMLSNYAIDNVCHEHLTYFSMHSFKECADRAGLEVAGCETNDVNGGSFRVYLTQRTSGLYGLSTDRQVAMFTNMLRMMHDERTMGLGTKATYVKWGQEVEQNFDALCKYMVSEVARGEKIWALGASTRGTVLLQLLNLPDGILKGVSERDASKYGLHMVGTPWAKIYPEETARNDATQMLVLPWHFKDSIYERELEWLKQGNHKLIFPLPNSIVMDWHGNGRKVGELCQEVTK